MATKRITATLVERIRPPTEGRLEIYDDLLSGFCLRVTQRGRKSWSVVYRKSVILLAGGLLVGLMGDRAGINAITGVFITPFQGVLVFFLLEMGVVAALRLR